MAGLRPLRSHEQLEPFAIGKLYLAVNCPIVKVHRCTALY